MGRLIVSNDNGTEEMDGSIGIYSFVVPEDRVYGDALVARIFGLSPQALTVGAPIADVLRHVRDGDRQRLAKAMHKAIVTGQFYEETYTIVHTDGRQFTVSALGRCLRDGSGLPWIYSGTVAIQTTAAIAPSDDPLEKHCHAALEIARSRRNALAARYLSSALSVLSGIPEKQ